MDDLKFGTRDKRGNWAPNQPLEIAPFWTGKWSKLGHWMIAYLWPHNTIFMAVTVAYWFLVLPDWDVMKTFSWGWMLKVHLVNTVGTFLLFGAVELFYYVRREQGTRFKYNHKFPSDTPSEVFWFRSQNIDNFLRTFCISLPLWTLFQCFTL
jgi:sterol desaturase/sphingolipid hydroxylase (fatty acid hydroxylase superfamily)